MEKWKTESLCMYYYLLPLHCLKVHSGSWNQYHQQPEALQCIPEKKQQFTLKFTPEETINLFSILQGFCIVGGHLFLLSFLTDHEVVSSSSADLPYNKRRKKRTNKAQKQASESAICHKQIPKILEHKMSKSSFRFTIWSKCFLK